LSSHNGRLSAGAPNAAPANELGKLARRWPSAASLPPVKPSSCGASETRSSGRWHPSWSLRWSASPHRRRHAWTIRDLTGRNVVAFLSRAHVEPDITIEIFFVDGPLPGFGAVEVTEPEYRTESGAHHS
jgi:hypothetical protein